MKGAVTVTGHAVERYIDRVRPDLSYDEAKAQLLELALVARRLSERTPNGEELWQLEDGSYLVVKNASDGRIGVTVLPLRELELVIATGATEDVRHVSVVEVAVNDVLRQQVASYKHQVTKLQAKLHELKSQLTGKNQMCPKCERFWNGVAKNHRPI